MNVDFQRQERREYWPQLPVNLNRHGFAGWLPTQVADPTLREKDFFTWTVLKDALNTAGTMSSVHSIHATRRKPIFVISPKAMTTRASGLWIR